MPPTTEDFKRELRSMLRVASKSGYRTAQISAGEIHRRVGGYPSHNHRIPVCCAVMRSLMRPGDRIVSSPRKGAGASLTIRYNLPLD